MALVPALIVDGERPRVSRDCQADNVDPRNHDGHWLVAIDWPIVTK